MEVAHFITIYDADEKNAENKGDTAQEGVLYQAGSAFPNALISSRLVSVLATGREIQLKAKRALDIWLPMSNAKVAT